MRRGLSEGSVPDYTPCRLPARSAASRCARWLLRLTPLLVPWSAGVYCVYLTLLASEHHGLACALLGFFIYLASAFACLRGSITVSSPVTPSVLDPLTHLAASRLGMFALTNMVAFMCYLYLVFMQHVLVHREGEGRDVLPSLSLVERLLDSRAGLVALVHAGYSLLFSCFQALRAHAFGARLYEEELGRLTSKAASYMAAKTVLLAVLAPDPLGLVLWLSWFSLLGFLRSVACLVGLRMQRIRQEPTAPRGTRRLVTLAHMLLGSSFWWLGVAALFTRAANAGWQTFFLLGVDCILLTADTLAALSKRWCMDVAVWERRRRLEAHLDLAYDVLCASAVVLQHAHTWLINGLWGTLLDLFLSVNVYAEVVALAARLTAHSKFCERAAEVRLCPVASPGELRAFDDHCAVCLERLTAEEGDGRRSGEEGRMAATLGRPRRLCCGHIFHSACLSAWLEQHRSCPTCRAPTAFSGQGEAAREELELEELLASQPARSPTMTPTSSAGSMSSDWTSERLGAWEGEDPRQAPAGWTAVMLD